jgi:hypothetical protein
MYPVPGGQSQLVSLKWIMIAYSSIPWQTPTAVEPQYRHQAHDVATVNVWLPCRNRDHATTAVNSMVKIGDEMRSGDHPGHPAYTPSYKVRQCKIASRMLLRAAHHST